MHAQDETSSKQAILDTDMNKIIHLGAAMHGDNRDIVVDVSHVRRELQRRRDESFRAQNGKAELEEDRQPDGLQSTRKRGDTEAVKALMRKRQEKAELEKQSMKQALSECGVSEFG